MFRNAVLMGLFCVLLATGQALAQSIVLDQVGGQLYGDVIRADTTISIRFRLATADHNIIGFSNGFRVYSLDGAEWESLWPDTTGGVSQTNFDLGVFLQSYVTGSISDTVSFAGAIMEGGGLPAGYNGSGFLVNLGPLGLESSGRTVCVDSCWFPLNNRWTWVDADNETVVPEWNGPYCFVVAGPNTSLWDWDGDGVPDTLDNCPVTANASQEDIDGDGTGDLCDPCNDIDGDGYGHPAYANECPDDNCPDQANPDQVDTDEDGIGDVCDDCTDSDSDGFGDPGFDNLCPDDNCPYVNNPEQDDIDADGLGFACDPCVDVDGDGFGSGGAVPTECGDDNCPDAYNPDQSDGDRDGVGDVCDDCFDSDHDGFGDPGHNNQCPSDNCPQIANPGQEDIDGDGIGDACCCDQRADINHDGVPCDIADIVYLVAFMFQDGPAPTCMMEADTAGDGTFADITDLVWMVGYMFHEGPAPAPCP